MAGWLEPRKNEKYLLELWRSVLSRLTDPPALVFVGGLADASYLQELQLSAVDMPRAFFFFNVDDEELAWFYENCLFTVFPSEAEGWGLPITGKRSIAVSTASPPTTRLCRRRARA